jgi:hypothetical protein
MTEIKVCIIEDDASRKIPAGGEYPENELLNLLEGTNAAKFLPLPASQFA